MSICFCFRRPKATLFLNGGVAALLLVSIWSCRGTQSAATLEDASTGVGVSWDLIQRIYVAKADLKDADLSPGFEGGEIMATTFGNREWISPQTITATEMPLRSFMKEPYRSVPALNRDGTLNLHLSTLKKVSVPLVSDQNEQAFVNPFDFYANSELVYRCPFDFSVSDLKFMDEFGTQHPVLRNRSNFQWKNADGAMKLEHVSFRKDQIRLHFSCEWSESFYQFSYKFITALKYSKPVILLRGPNYNLGQMPPLALTDVQTDFVSTKTGTRFFGLASGDRTVLQKWDLRTKGLLVDDVSLRSSSPANRSGVHKGLLRAVQSLRRQLPELGNKISLCSEASDGRCPKTPDVYFYWQNTEEAEGIGATVIDDETGEVLGGRVGLKTNGVYQQTNDFFEWLKGQKLLRSVDDEWEYFDMQTAMHEFGHILGLRHNFAGFGCKSTGDTYFNSTMGYPLFNIFPMSLAGVTLEYKPHDLESLKILYAELFANPEQVRSQAIAKVKTMPLSANDASLAGLRETHNAVREVAKCWSRRKTADLDAFRKLNGSKSLGLIRAQLNRFYGLDVLLSE